MAKQKIKDLTVKIGQVRYRLREGQVILDDGVTGGYEDHYNKPCIKLQFHPEGVDHDWDDAYVWITFQRNLIKGDGANDRGTMDSPVYGRMDTCKRWGNCYGGHVALQDLERVDLGRSELSVGSKNKLRLKLSGMIGQAISEYNLHVVATDECEQAVLALEKLGAFVEWMYSGGRGDAIDLRNASNRGANEKARQKQRSEAERSEPVLLWTHAPESYDSGTTRTVETGPVAKDGNPWRKVAVQPDEVDWHRGRYGSGLYAVQEAPPASFQIKDEEAKEAHGS